MQITFGRLLPSHAKSHYKTVILKRVYNAWKDEWWTSRREWSLTLRAECHYRFFLYKYTFSKWMEFLVLQKEKKMKVQKAQTFADRQRLHHTLERWEDFTQTQKMKKQNLGTALQLYKQSVFKVTWSKWRRKLRHIQSLYLLEGEALKQWRTSIQHKVLVCWRNMYTVSCHNSLNELKALNHNTTRLKRKTLNLWVGYVFYRCRKYKLKVSAQNTNKLRLMRLYWTKWCQALYEQWNEDVRLEAAGHLATRICQRRVIHRWKAYVKLCHEKTRSTNKAQEHCHQHLLSTAFDALAHNVQSNKSKRLNSNVAVQHYHQTILGKFWRMWQECLEEAEDRSFQLHTEKAQVIYSIYLSRVCFNFWREKLAELRHMQTMAKRADMLFAEHIVPRCFQSWLNFTHRKTIYKQRTVQAQLYYRQRQFSWAFYTWWDLSEKHKEQELAEQMAVCHVEQKQMQKVWILWRNRAGMRIKEREKQDILKHLYRKQLLKKAMALWKENIAEIKDRRNREIQAFHHGDLCILRWAVEKWRKFVQIQKIKKEKAEDMHQYHEVQLLKQSFATWKAHNLQMYSVYAQVDVLHKHQTQRCLRKMLGKWQENAAEASKFRIKKQMARNHHRHVVQFKAFASWREETVHAVAKYHQQMAVCSIVQESTNKGQLLHYFRKWREQTRHVQTERLHLCKAEEHYDVTILSKAIRAWENHHNQYQKYKVMKRQASLLLKLKIWQSFFDLWKFKLLHKRREAKQTECALWHWSLSLQAKVLFAWKQHVADQRQEREKVVRAAELYRDKLLREGVSCILTYAAQMSDLTTSLTQQTQQQHPRRLQRVVRRCALKWKYKALSKKKSQAVNLQQSKKSVTFFLPEIRGDSQEEEDQALMNMLLTHMPRRQPRCSEELLKSPPKLLESAELGPSVMSLGGASQSHDPSSAGVHLTSTQLSFNTGTGLLPLPCEDTTQNQELLLPPSAFMTAISQSPEDLPHEQSSRSMPSDPVADLTNELVGIKQDMKNYLQDKKQLRAWCKLRNVLETWLQTSGQDHLAEKDDVCQELEELEKTIAQLASKLSKQKPRILQHVDRIQNLHAPLHPTLSASPK